MIRQTIALAFGLSTFTSYAVWTKYGEMPYTRAYLHNPHPNIRTYSHPPYQGPSFGLLSQLPGPDWTAQAGAVAALRAVQRSRAPQNHHIGNIKS